MWSSRPEACRPLTDFAYTDDRCLGRTQADLRRLGLELPDPAATLQSREVERLADFLFAKVIRQGSDGSGYVHRLLGFER